MGRSSSPKNFYEVLHVSKNASEEEIRKQYKKLAMKYHPDRGGDPEKCKEINEAYAVLSDAQKRKQYDMFGSIPEGMGMGSDGGMPPEMNDIFDNLFGNMFPFSGAAGGGIPGFFHRAETSSSSSNSNNNARKASNRVCELKVTLEEVYRGSVVLKTVKKKVVRDHYTRINCSDCRGTGTIVQQIQMGFISTQTVMPCSACSGTGCRVSPQDLKEIDAAISITIPKGIQSGQSILLQGKGDELPGMSPGDLVFKVQYETHPLFRIHPDRPQDLIYELSMSFQEYLYGFETCIPFLSGESLQIYHKPLSLPMEWSPRSLIRKIPKMGLPCPNPTPSMTGGDLYIHCHISFPPSLVMHESFRQMMQSFPAPSSKQYSCSPSSSLRWDLASLSSPSFHGGSDS